MFHIYSPQGRVFSGSLERLRKVERSSGGPSSTRILSDDPLDEEFRAAETANLSSMSSVKYQVSNQAKEHYQAMLRDNNAREAVYHAYEIMSTGVITISLDDTILQAYDLFQRHDFQMIPAIGQTHQLAGMISRRDIYKAMLDPAKHSKTLHQFLIEKQQAVVSAEAVTDIRRIATILTEQKTDAIPIVEESGAVVGIVSRTDILNCLTKDPPLSLWC